MRVLQINVVYGEKSTGRTCVEVERALVSNGDEVLTAYGKGNTASRNAYLIDTPLEYYLHNALSRITGLQGYYSFFATLRLLRRIKEFNPDVIHLRNLHGNYLNLPMLFRFLATYKKPVIQSLHDCWPYTGKCVYYSKAKCERWMDNCGKCPNKTEYPTSYVFDTSRFMLDSKKRWYANINDLWIIGVSNWVTGECKKSFHKNRDISRIYNWVDLDSFKPYNKRFARKEYNLDPNTFIILGVSAQWNISSVRYQDFIKLADMIDESMQIVLVGEAKHRIDHPHVHHISFVDSLVNLAKIYSLADVYIHMSIEDTFGKVIAEAQACNTPVIAYKSTGIPEVVGKGCGYIVEPRDVEEIYKKVSDIASGREIPSGMRLWVESQFSYDRNVMELISTYHSILSKKHMDYGDGR